MPTEASAADLGAGTQGGQLRGSSSQGRVPALPIIYWGPEQVAQACSYPHRGLGGAPSAAPQHHRSPSLEPMISKLSFGTCRCHAPPAGSQKEKSPICNMPDAPTGWPHAIACTQTSRGPGPPQVGQRRDPQGGRIPVPTSPWVFFCPNQDKL